jgi:dTDP-4-amino-4,6-dideoxygalactose transaminase
MMREQFLPYCRPDISGLDIQAVVESLSNGWLTTGPRVQELENAFASASGVKHAIAVNSCTAALHIGLLCAGVGPEDEVITPSLPFVAGAQCVLELGAKPIFCDVEPDSFSLTVETIRAVVSPKTKAIIAMPYAGRPLGVRRIVEFARERGITVIEDAAHAAGMLDRGSWAGTYSDAAAYSFYATKNLTSAEGGVLLTNSDTLAERARSLSLHGMNRDAWKRYTNAANWRYDVREPGFKYNMPDVLASLGLSQLRRLDAMQLRRHELAARYRDRLDGMTGLSLQTAPENTEDQHSYCMFAVRVDARKTGVDRDMLIERLNERKIGTSVHYIPTHLFSGYSKLARAPLPVTDQIATEILSLPLYPSMSDADLDDVVEGIRESLGSRRTASSP